MKRTGREEHKKKTKTEKTKKHWIRLKEKDGKHTRKKNWEGGRQGGTARLYPGGGRGGRRRPWLEREMIIGGRTRPLHHSRGNERVCHTSEPRRAKGRQLCIGGQGGPNQGEAASPHTPAVFHSFTRDCFLFPLNFGREKCVRVEEAKKRKKKEEEKQVETRICGRSKGEDEEENIRFIFWLYLVLLFFLFLMFRTISISSGLFQ